MKFKGHNGHLPDSSYISLDIEGGDNKNSIGDQVWISKCGTKMEIYEDIEEDVFTETVNLFEGGHRQAFKGAMRRSGVSF